MTIIVDTLETKSWENSTTNQDFEIKTNNGIIHVLSISGTVDIQKKDGSGTYRPFSKQVAAGEEKILTDIFTGEYRIVGTNFNFEYGY